MEINTDKEFIAKVDHLIQISEHDAELKAGLKFVDDQSKKHCISFYDEFFHILQNHLAEEHAKEWIKNR
jgi:hypothetical protein